MSSSDDDIEIVEETEMDMEVISISSATSESDDDAIDLENSMDDGMVESANDTSSSSGTEMDDTEHDDDVDREPPPPAAPLIGFQNLGVPRMQELQNRQVWGQRALQRMGGMNPVNPAPNYSDTEDDVSREPPPLVAPLIGFQNLGEFRRMQEEWAQRALGHMEEFINRVHQAPSSSDTEDDDANQRPQPAPARLPVRPQGLRKVRVETPIPFRRARELLLRGNDASDTEINDVGHVNQQPPPPATPTRLQNNGGDPGAPELRNGIVGAPRRLVQVQDLINLGEQMVGNVPTSPTVDLSAVSSILIDVDPIFVEELWVASNKNRVIFNTRVLDLFDSQNYRKISIDVVDLMTPEKMSQKRRKSMNFTKPNLECECCYDEVPFDETVECGREMHSFCKACIVKSCEVALGDGLVVVKCMATEDCLAPFSLASLEPVLPATLFKKLTALQQIEEVTQAGVEGLETCPFCEFAYVPPLDSSVFVCMKEGCLKSSCRLCKEESHIPLKCGEAAKEQDVRQKIENAMTETLIRQCYKCSKKYVKLDGCNKIICPCGAMMCYICRQPVKDYTHFNGQGGDQLHKCPLYSNNHALHIKAVQEAGKQAMAEELAKQPQVTLSYDPTKNMK